MKVRDILRFEGPFGTFTLREDSAKPIVFLASGTGFAPIKSMIEACIAKSVDRPAVLYWGGRRPGDLYLHELAQSWETIWPGFHFIPVVSDAVQGDAWVGRTGFVHHAVLEDYPDLSGHQVYACGAPIVVESARRDFVGLRGLPLEEFFADAFTTEADLARQPTVAG
jgi:CDP-4-dehydro-6-deoxyglucose reductase